MTKPLVTFNWTDLETTGLSRKTCHILEIASILTDSDLNVIDKFESIVIPACYDGTKESLGMDDFVTDMHTENGLLEAIDVAYRRGWASQLSIEEVSKQYVHWLKGHGITPDTPKYAPKGEDGERDYTVQTKPYLAGSTAGPFDKPFLEDHAPAIVECLHHRVLDISALKVAAEAWRPDVEWPKAGGAHRALADIQESIEHMAVLRDDLLQGAMPFDLQVEAQVKRVTKIENSTLISEGDLTITA